MKEFTITGAAAGQRLDKYLKRILPEASVGFLCKMLRKKNITLNNRKADGKELLSEGDLVKIFFSDETFAAFAGRTDRDREIYDSLKGLSMGGLVILTETEDMLAAAKPANMLSQKAKDSDISANERLLGYLIREGELSFEAFLHFHPSVCNRLDRNTTGLLLMGKTLKGSRRLSEGLKTRSFRKIYRALVAGRLDQPGCLKGYLVKDHEKNLVALMDQAENAKEEASYVETAFTPLASSERVSLVEIHLITGKTHQIRAHLASIGHPVIGDMKYGKPEVNAYFYEHYRVKHQLLHAYLLEFPDGNKITAPEPPVYRKILAGEEEA